MPGDSDGPENNDACVPVEPAPGFTVAKEAVTEGPVVADADGRFTAEYKITVSNTAEVAGTSGQVTDVLTLPQQK